MRQGAEGDDAHHQRVGLARRTGAGGGGAADGHELEFRPQVWDPIIRKQIDT
ncbi:hypothetical protein D9M73_291620 [compost metagenome]